MTDTRRSIAVLGAGSWGTALAILLSRNGFDVRLWGHTEEHILQLQNIRENVYYLPGLRFPENLHPTPDLAQAVAGVEEVLVVVPSHAFRSVTMQVNPLMPGQTSFSWATKGLEPGARRLLSEVAREILGDRDIAVISGPTFAGEVVRSLPTAITVASSYEAHAQRLATLLHSETFRTYTSSDMIGVQVGGATKNVLAIAAGIADGLGFGANTRAALITRGLKEIMRLGQAMGGEKETLMGLAGLGDLALTCTDNQSRNRRMGLELANGLTIKQARNKIGQEVEGVRTTNEVHLLAEELGVDMPITEQIYRVLNENLPPKDAVHNLLERRLKTETD